MVRVSELLVAAIPAGIGLGLGLWTLVALLPRFGAPRLGARIAPYLLDVSPEARRLVRRRPVEPGSVIGGLLAPCRGAGARRPRRSARR